MTTKEYIWSYLIRHGCTAEGAAALMGNIQAESAFKVSNLQDSYNSSLGYSDDGYTAAVDRGSYGNFIYDAAGYGLCQWTYHSRKAGLLSFAKQRGVSIGNLDMQLDYALKEIREGYPQIWQRMTTGHEVQSLAMEIMVKFENPADQSLGTKQYRANLATNIFNEFADKPLASEPIEEPAENRPQVTYIYRNIEVPELGIGTKCDAVSALQALLCCRGYRVDITGQFDSNTRTALATYQDAMALYPDGICGKILGLIFLTDERGEID